jgi:hypothetical protein
MATTFLFFAIVGKFAWYVVGAVVYWKTVDGSCSDGSQIRSFGLGLFVIDTLLFALAYCARKAQDAAS